MSRSPRPPVVLPTADLWTVFPGPLYANVERTLLYRVLKASAHAATIEAYQVIAWAYAPAPTLATAVDPHPDEPVDVERMFLLYRKWDTCTNLTLTENGPIHMDGTPDDFMAAIGTAYDMADRAIWYQATAGGTNGQTWQPDGDAPFLPHMAAHGVQRLIGVTAEDLHLSMPAVI